MFQALLTEPVDVDISSGFPWPEVVSAVAIILAAVGGAFAAARFANSRLDKQLAAAQEQLDSQLAAAAAQFHRQLQSDDHRLSKQLAADRMRLDRELDHDRRMRNRDETRSTLDDVTRIMLRTIRTTSDFAASIDLLDEKRDEWLQLRARNASDAEIHEAEQEMRGAIAMARDMHDEASAATEEGLGAVARLRIRFEPGDDLLQAYERWQQMTRSWFDSQVALIETPRTEVHARASAELFDAAQSAFQTFLSASRGWIEESGRR